MFNLFVCTGRYSWVVRFVHCGLTFGVIGSLLFTKSYIYHIIINKNDYLIVILFILSHLFCLVVYLVLTFMNPGFLPIIPYNDDESDESDLDGSESHFKKLTTIKRICHVCKVEQPLRTKHCNECNRCVRRYDHHCPWIDNCVGQINHPLFVVFMAYQLFINCWSGYWSWLSIYNQVSWLLWFKFNWCFLTNLVIVVVSGLPLMALLLFHLYLACINSTTWEQVSRNKISYLKKLNPNIYPFHQSYCTDFCQFCCRYNYPTNWESRYSRFGWNRNDSNSNSMSPLTEDICISSNIPLNNIKNNQSKPNI